MLGLPGLANLDGASRATLIATIDGCLEASVYGYSKEGGIGVVTSSLQTTMQWFAISLLSGRLPFLKPGETPVLVETTEYDLLLTFAVSDTTRFSNGTIASQHKVEVFGEVWDLVTIRVPELGVLKARQMVLTNRLVPPPQSLNRHSHKKPPGATSLCIILLNQGRGKGGGCIAVRQPCCRSVVGFRRPQIPCQRSPQVRLLQVNGAARVD